MGVKSGKTINSKRISIVLPTYNEKHNIKNMIERTISSVKDLHEIIVIDDDSPDGTAGIVSKISSTNPKVRLILRTEERGLASALARGIRESTGNVIGWMDADLGMPPEDIPSLIRNIPEYDVAIGSRYAEGGRDIRDFKRRLTSRMINLFTNMLLGFSIKDFNSGFVFAKKKVFDDVHIMEKGYGQYCIRFLYDCLKKGYKIREIGYSFTERSKGVSKTGSSIWPLLKHGWNYGIEVIKIKVGRS